MREKQYRSFLDEFNQRGPVKLGISASRMFRHDPKYMAFKLARYKFVAKMLEGKEEVLEIGAGEGFASHIVAQHVKRLICTDFDEIFVENGKNICERENMEFLLYDPLKDRPFNKKFEAIYFLDVLEHIKKEDENLFIKNILTMLEEDGVVIIGTPSLESQKYASEHNKIGHVNCKSGYEFRIFLENFFNNVFLFSVNDEIIHTGFSKMAHYLIALCVGKK